MSDPTDLPLFADADQGDSQHDGQNHGRIRDLDGAHPKAAARRLAGAIPGLTPAAGSAPHNNSSSDGSSDDSWDSVEAGSTRPLLRLAPLDAPSADPSTVREIQGLVSTQLTRRDGDRPRTLEDQGHTARAVLRDEITAYNQRRLRGGEPALDPQEQSTLRQAVLDALFGLGRIQPLLDLPGLQSLVVRGHDNVWLMFSDGRVERGPAIANNDEDLIEEISRISRQLGVVERPFDRIHNNLDLALPGGARLSAQGWFTPYPQLTIRLPSFPDVDMDQLRQLGTHSRAIQEFVTALIRAQKNVLISGVPKAGKTVYTRGVLSCLHPQIGLATLETEDELRLWTMPERHHMVWAGQEMVGAGEIVNGRVAGQLTVDDMIPAALRGEVQIIIVGEVRGHEIMAMLQAMQVGHNSVSTIHAKNGKDTVDRMVTLATMHGGGDRSGVLGLVASLVDAIVHIDLVDETYIGGRQHRYVDEIVLPELSGDASFSVPAVFRPGPDGRAIPDRAAIAHRTDLLDQLARVGFDPDWLNPNRGGWDHPLDLKLSRS